MRRSISALARETSCRVLLGLLAVGVACPAPAASSAESGAASPDRREAMPQRAVWVRKRLNLVYLQSVTHYSCYFLSDYVRHILLQLGARERGLDIHPVDCSGGPPSVAGSFDVLEPAPEGAAASPNSQASTVAAHWRRVEVSDNAPFERVLDVTAKCQLVRTVFDRVLPLFAVRDAHLAPGCEMYQHLTSAASLRATVLKADAEDSPEAASLPR